jgi:hypothetical protein
MTSQGSTPTVVVELEKHPTLPMSERPRPRDMQAIGHAQ